MILYGTSVSSGIITTASIMTASAPPGTETSKTTLISNANHFGEVWSKGTGSSLSVTAIPATPTGNGWAFTPGAGSFAAASWSASIGLSGLAGEPVTMTIRFFRYSSGTYTSIGSINSSITLSASRATVSFAATSMGASTFAGGDLLYIDLWLQDATGAGGDSPVIYISNSTSAGVANDMQVTTSTFTPSSTTTTYTVNDIIGYAETLSTLGSITIPDSASSYAETLSTLSSRTINEQAPSYVEQVFWASSVITVIDSASSYAETVSILYTKIATISDLDPGQQEHVTTTPISQAAPTAPMTQFDLEAQYLRIENSAIIDRLQFCAITYYSAGGSTKIVDGELDALLVNEDISMLHVLQTINDVNLFINSYDYMSSMLEDNPFAYYRMGDGGGSFLADISGNNLAGNRFGTITPGQAGAINNDPNTAMAFDGSTGYITLPAQLNTNNWSAFTFETWIKLPAGTADFYRILANDAAYASNVGFEWGLAPASAGYLGYLDVGLGSTVTTNHFNGSLLPNVWYHLAVTWNNGDVNFFLNGQNIGHVSSTGGAIAPGGYLINIGRNPVGNQNFLNGSLDELAIFPYALDPSRFFYRYQIAQGMAL